MKLLYVCILDGGSGGSKGSGESGESKVTGNILAEHSILQGSFLKGIIHHHSVQLFRFVTSTIIDKLIQNGKKGYNSIEDGDLILHCYIDAAVTYSAITDKEYPTKVAYRFLEQVARTWRDSRESDDDPTDMISTAFKHYGDVRHDTIYKIQTDIKETREIIMQNIEKLFERGEKLEDLIEKSEKLSEETRTFYRRARDKNRMCPWLWSWLW